MCADVISYYRVAGLGFALRGEGLCRAVAAQAGFRPFVWDPLRSDPPAQAAFVVEEAPPGEQAPVQEAPPARTLVYETRGGVGNHRFYRSPQGYAMDLAGPQGEEVQLWQAGPHRYFYKGDLAGPGLRFALWLAYGLGALPHHRLFLHASAVVYAGKAYLFLGESGTGKSTHTRLWLNHIPGARLLNDDSPLLELRPDGSLQLWGGPWSGKTPCYHNLAYPPDGCVLLVQAPHNRITRLSPLQALAALHPATPPQFARTPLYDRVAPLLSALLGSVPCYRLECLPNPSAARLSFETLTAPSGGSC